MIRVREIGFTPVNTEIVCKQKDKIRLANTIRGRT